MADVCLQTGPSSILSIRNERDKTHAIARWLRPMATVGIRNINVHRFVSMTFALLLAAGLGFALTQPAHASPSLATCNEFKIIPDSVGQFAEVPDVQSTGSVACILGRGDVSAAVSVLQSDLIQCYQARINQDADFGPATMAALKNAQAREGVTADGVYGPVTLSALHWPEFGGPNPNACIRL